MRLNYNKIDDFQLAKHSSSNKYTFIITPNLYGKTRRYTISSFGLGFLFVLGCVFVVGTVILSVSYIGLLASYNKSKEDLALLQDINKEQQIQLSDMDEMVKDVNQKLEYLDLLEDKIQIVINESSSQLTTDESELVAEIDAKLYDIKMNTAVGGGVGGLSYYVSDVSMSDLDISDSLRNIKVLLSDADTRISEESENYTDLSFEVSEYDRLSNRYPHSNPLPDTEYRISQHFEYRSYPRVEFHSGCDLACDYDSPIHPVAKGTVTFAGYQGELGYCVYIDHGNGYVSVYAHMCEVYTYQGAEVNVDDIIGGVGSTGYSTGNHLHLEIRENGTKVDPELFIEL